MVRYHVKTFIIFLFVEKLIKFIKLFNTKNIYKLVTMYHKNVNVIISMKKVGK